MASPASLSVMDAPFCQPVSSISADLASPLSVLVKDASKRKRVNRKLKQCKLDARREQWLSQVTTTKHGKDCHQEPQTSSKLDLGEIVHTENHDNLPFGPRDLHRYSSESLDKTMPHSHLCIRHPENCEEEDLKDPSRSSSCISDCFEAEFSPKSVGSQSPKSKVKRVGNGYQRENRGRSANEFPGNERKDGIAGNDRCVIDHKADEHDLESEDEDWEAAADALGLNPPQENVCSTGLREERIEDNGNLNLSQANSLATSEPINHKLAAPCEVISRSCSGRAWRPDDTHRPASLPNLSNLRKEQSLPARFVGQKQQWMCRPKVLQDPPSGPSLCPICAEELDTTDSSFEPCACGFQLCLFCHHRIVSDDGRCPGCRRFYNSISPVTSSAPALSLC
eukprot:c25607_g1_i1 orf=199-1383(+)